MALLKTPLELGLVRFNQTELFFSCVNKVTEKADVDGCLLPEIRVDGLSTQLFSFLQESPGSLYR